MGVTKQELEKFVDNYFKPHFIAYIDVLGYKSIFEGKTPFIQFYNTNRFVKWTKKETPALFSKLLSDFIALSKNLSGTLDAGIKQKIFSDNFLFCTEENWEDLLAFVSILQSFFVEEGILVRGALFYGDLHYSDESINGLGLIGAVDAEKRARYPRIVVDGSFFEGAHIMARQKYKDLENLDALTWSKEKGLCALDFDNEIFIDYLENLKRNVLEDESEKGYLNLKSVLTRQKIYTTLKMFTNSDAGVLEKLKWCRDYHDYFCKRHKLDDYIMNEISYENLLKPENLDDGVKHLISIILSEIT